MGLLKHPKSAYRNKNLDNPAHINVKHKLTPNDININNKPAQTHDSAPQINRVTTPVNIRVDNHIRNEISVLIQLGYADTNKDLVGKLVEEKAGTLDPEQSKRFNYLKNILEQKDYANYKFKHHN